MSEVTTHTDSVEVETCPVAKRKIKNELCISRTFVMTESKSGKHIISKVYHFLEVAQCVWCVGIGLGDSASHAETAAQDEAARIAATYLTIHDEIACTCGKHRIELTLVELPFGAPYVGFVTPQGKELL